MSVFSGCYLLVLLVIIRGFSLTPIYDGIGANGGVRRATKRGDARIHRSIVIEPIAETHLLITGERKQAKEEKAEESKSTRGGGGGSTTEDRQDKPKMRPTSLDPPPPPIAYPRKAKIDLGTALIRHGRSRNHFARPNRIGFSDRSHDTSYASQNDENSFGEESEDIRVEPLAKKEPIVGSSTTTTAATSTREFRTEPRGDKSSPLVNEDARMQEVRGTSDGSSFARGKNALDEIPRASRMIEERAHRNESSSRATSRSNNWHEVETLRSSKDSYAFRYYEGNETTLRERGNESSSVFKKYREYDEAYDSGTYEEMYEIADAFDDESNVSIVHGSSNNSYENDYERKKYDEVRLQDRQRSQRESAREVDDIVTRFLRIIENQQQLGENCTAGTDLNLGEGVVDRYAQERFRLEANLAVNRANMLTRLWKYAPRVMLSSEYLLHASVLSMVEFDEDIFAAGNCYDKLSYKNRWLYCPFAHRLQDNDGVIVKDLATEYKYLSNSSEWFYIARKNAERVIASNNQFSRGYHAYAHNGTEHLEREEDEILTVKYEDGRWSKPYYDCGGGNIWMLTYTVPFFGYANDTYYFKGTSGIDIDLRRVDIDQCPLPLDSTQLNIFAASDKCKKRTTECVAIPGLGFRRGSYRCVCKRGFYFPDTKSPKRYYNGTVIEEEYEKLMMVEESQYAVDGVFECLPCAEGCESCEDGSPCIASLNWLMRTAILILECCVIACLPLVILFTWKYGNVKVVRAASPVLLRVIVLGAFFIYCTTIVMYPRPNVITCTVRVWLREIGFSLTYGALMLKTWRISVIFRVRSAKAVKITDVSLLKRLGIIVMIFTVFLSIRTLVAPPVVIVARTADDLKAYLCRTDWWDHSFTTLEVMFLIWGIRLCIVVRKTPSEFNESRFISMAIYNEFLLSVFLNVSMLFLQSPANPDLLYIIFFCHTQLTVTLLLCLIFGSKVYVVFRGGGKEEATGKIAVATGKFLGKSGRSQGTNNRASSISLQQGNYTDDSDSTTEEFRRLLAQLDILREKNSLLGNYNLVDKIAGMLELADRIDSQSSQVVLPITNDSDERLAVEETELGAARDELGDRQECKRRTIDLEDRMGKRSFTRSAERTDSTEPESENRPIREGPGNVTVATVFDATSDDLVADSSSEIKRKEASTSSSKHKSKSGHARTHAIVINLDDKSRFSEEVTV